VFGVVTLEYQGDGAERRSLPADEAARAAET
jgi:hypothetical protein